MRKLCKLSAAGLLSAMFLMNGATVWAGEKADTVYHGGKIYTMFNPVIKQAIVPYMTEEGCLSLGYDTVTKRFKRITVEFNAIENGEWVSRKRKLTDWNAQIVQHAIDHCNGLLV